jgi:hypothetical protein
MKKKRRIKVAKKPCMEVPSPEKRREFDISENLKSFVPYPPASRLFKIGDLVNYGSHPNCIIVGVFDQGRVYEIKTWGTYREYTKVVQRENHSIVTWGALLPLSAINKDTEFVQNSDIRIQYSNMTIDSMISTYYNSGIDMNPSYQRDYVWSIEDKVSLIDSIFCNRAIGTYILCFRGYQYPKIFEILDGKQRINAIINYYEDKFPYKGKLFSEISARDRSHFEDIMFPRAEIELPTLEQKIKVFIHVNTSGKHMSVEHLEKVKGMLNE